MRDRLPSSTATAVCGDPKRRVRRWSVLLNVVSVPLNILSWLLDLVARLAEWLSWRVDDLSALWKRRVRVWAGLTPDGRTPEQVAEQEAARQRTLAELRESLAASRAAQRNKDTEAFAGAEPSHT